MVMIDNGMKNEAMQQMVMMAWSTDDEMLIQ